MTDNSRIIASQDLTTAGFYDMADEWSTSRKIEKYGAFRTRDSYVEASGLTDLVNGDKVIVTWVDQGAHPSTIGDVGSNAGQTPNSGYYVYNAGLQKLVRTAPLEAEVVKGLSDTTTAKAQQVTESQNTINTIKTDIDSKYNTIVSANNNVDIKASQVTEDKDTVAQLKADTLVTRNEALSFSGGKIKATYVEAVAITGLLDGDIVAVLASDTGTHTAVSGDVGSSGGQTPNSGYYKYSTSLTALVRVGDLESVIAINEADRAEATADSLNDRLTVINETAAEYSGTVSFTDGTIIHGWTEEGLAEPAFGYRTLPIMADGLVHGGTLSASDDDGSGLRFAAYDEDTGALRFGVDDQGLFFCNIDPSTIPPAPTSEEVVSARGSAVDLNNRLSRTLTPIGSPKTSIQNLDRLRVLRSSLTHLKLGGGRTRSCHSRWGQLDGC